ncbi:hypothetical protein EYB45_08505 [Erythrobacteraceae bacterium CFH 75059]|nr:hypothetical protein EYB45_08505 [Erythrobacteraceae bacterium CFH 75059]
MKRDGVPVRMPPNPAPHIINRLVEIGLTEAGAMAPVPLSWREIHYWQQNTGVCLSAWEARTIRDLSVAYVAEGRRAEAMNCPPPWRAEVTQRERELDEARLEAMFGESSQRFNR